jgi:hypothetical protein
MGPIHLRLQAIFLEVAEPNICTREVTAQSVVVPCFRANHAHAGNLARRHVKPWIQGALETYADVVDFLQHQNW